MPNLSSPTLPGIPHKFWENIAEMAYLPDVSQNPVYGGFRVSRQLPYDNMKLAMRGHRSGRCMLADELVMAGSGAPMGGALG